MAEAADAAEPMDEGYVVDAKRDRLVIVASTLGTVFEWYDFFIYGTLAAVIGRHFFPAGSETAQFLLALATFGVGFGVRPLGRDPVRLFSATSSGANIPSSSPSP